MATPERDEKSEEVTSEKWIDGSVGMCMSGGGYRAAAFHLGALAYLERLGMGKQLNVISTVSGGTFTGAKYILSLVEKQTFKQFFTAYYQALKVTNLVSEGLAHLASRASHVISGRQDLIVSMAQVYAEKFFCKPGRDGKPSEPYYFDAVLNGDQSVGDVIFNATDFRSGAAFRFQRSEQSTARIGNQYNYVQPEDAAKIRLADIVASSSCFPGGFEPFSFPYDFTWEGGGVPQAVRDAFPAERNYDDLAYPKGPVALMDGGVFDNQGLQSLMMADERDHNDLDLFIISDTDRPSLDLYNMPEPSQNGGMTLNGIKWLGLTFAGLCVITLVAILIHAVVDMIYGTGDWFKYLFLYAVPFVLSLTSAWVIWFLYKVVKEDVLTQIPLEGARAWDWIKRLTVGQVRNMLKLRVMSLLTLTSSVFMKRIRNLVYGLIYGHIGDLHVKSRYQKKRIANVIYTLAPSKTKEPPLDGIEKPSKALNQVACMAFNQGTTLWFDKDYEAPSLIAAGQASLCYNFFKLLARRYGKDPNQYAPEVKAKWMDLKSDWEQFNQDPFFALRDMVDENWDAILQEIMTLNPDWGMFEGEGQPEQWTEQ